VVSAGIEARDHAIVFPGNGGGGGGGGEEIPTDPGGDVNGGGWWGGGLQEYINEWQDGMDDGDF
jgi:hypothetical protein